ncbi:MAG: GNAT family N-acetyltransferase, partial [Solirubrobacteraceae bacterium]
GAALGDTRAMPALVSPERPLTDGVVTLRAWRPLDRDAVVAALQDPEIPRWTLVPSPYGPAQYDDWLIQQDEQRAAGAGLHLLIVDDEDRLLGATGVQLTEEAPDIGYWCAREQRRRGYTARAVRLLCGYVHALGFPRVDIFVHEDNRPSQRVAEAAGFTRRPGLHRVARLGDAPVYVRFTSS